MDEIDERLIGILKEDSRRPFVEMAREVNLSEAAVRRRVRNMVKAGTIKRFTVEVDLGQSANAIALISVSPTKPTPGVSERLKAIKGVEIVQEITGEYDVACTISTSSIAEINRCIDDIRKVEGVANTNTIIILKTLK